MAISVLVQRPNPVPVEGLTIVEPLLGSDEAAVSRGRAFLCEEGTGEEPVRYTTLFRPGVRPGQLVLVTDSIIGKDFLGKVTSVQHTVTRDGDTGALVKKTELTVKISTNFTVTST